MKQEDNHVETVSSRIRDEDIKPFYAMLKHLLNDSTKKNTKFGVSLGWTEQKKLGSVFCFLMKAFSS